MENKMGHSLVALKSVNEVKTFINQQSDFIRDQLTFELSYVMDGSFIKSVRFLKGKTHSVHSPCPCSKYLPNFGVIQKLLNRVQIL